MQQNKKKLSAVEYIPLDDIEHDNEQFQTRYTEYLHSKQQHKAESNSEDNIQKLKDKLDLLAELHRGGDTRKAHLEPIVVIKPEGKDNYLIVAGFHRYQAYLLSNEEAAKGNTKRKVIPANIFQGTVDEALLHSHQQDNKPNIPKDQNQLNTSAWIMIYANNTALAGLTRKEQALILDIKPNTLRKMITAKNKLNDNGGNYYPNWKDQVRAMNNPNYEEEEIKQKYDCVNYELGKFLYETHQGAFMQDTEMTKELILRILEEIHVKPEELMKDTEEIECDF